MPRTMMTAEEKLHKAKIKLQELHPFFAYLIMHMEGTPDDNCPTMGVDKKGNLWYNPAYVESLSDNLLRSCLAHEISHVILAHLARYHKDWSPELGNIAADIISNDLLDSEGFELDPGWIVPRNHEYAFQGKKGPVVIRDIDKKTMEEIYHVLEQNAQTKPQQSKCPVCGGSGQCPQDGGSGDDGDGDGNQDPDQQGQQPCPNCNGSGQNAQSQVPGMSGKSQDEHRQDPNEDQSDSEYDKNNSLPDEWKFKLAEAAAFAKQRGKLSGGLSQMVGDLIESKVDWRSQLLKYISAMLPYDFTWSKPARKAASLGVYLPAVLKEYLEVVVHIDSSGSISDKTIKEFMGEVKGILTGFEAVKMKLIICDCAIQQVYDLSPDNVPELEDLKIGGRGGTSHTPVVNWINENQQNTRIFISLTDGYSDIESCYEDLPFGTDRLILLDSDSSEMESRMQPYGDVICLGDQ
jgi:predicted metal-dependent peptidase